MNGIRDGLLLLQGGHMKFLQTILRVHATLELDCQKPRIEWRLPLQAVTKQTSLSQRTRKTNHYVIWKKWFCSWNLHRGCFETPPPAVIANGNSTVSYLHLPFWFGEALPWMKSCAPNVYMLECIDITCARSLETNYYYYWSAVCVSNDLSF